MILRAGGGAQLGRVPSRRGLGIGAVGPIGAGHPVHPRGIGVQVPQQGLLRRGLVALRVPAGQEPFVTPPDVESGPVDRVAGRRRGELAQSCGADAPTGEHDRGVTTGGLGVDKGRHQPSRDGSGQQPRVAMDDDEGWTHWWTSSPLQAGSRQTCVRVEPRLSRSRWPVAADSDSA